MIEKVETALQWVLGITVFLSFILLTYCIITKTKVNTWQFPMLLALFLDSIFIYAILRKTQGSRFNHSKTDSESLGRSPHRPL